MKNAHLKAVHDDDLKNLLTSLGCYDDVISGNCECFFCKKKIDESSIGSIFPYQNQICFSCDDATCLTKLIDLGGNGDVCE